MKLIEFLKNCLGHKSDGYSMQVICYWQWLVSHMGPRCWRHHQENAGDDDTVAFSMLPWVVWTRTKHTVLGVNLLLLDTTKYTDTGTERGSCVSSCVSSCSSSSALLLSCAPPMHPPSEVQHATAYKGRRWLVIGCHLCQSLTWCCSPEPLPPLSLSYSHTSTTLTSPGTYLKLVVLLMRFEYNGCWH